MYKLKIFQTYAFHFAQSSRITAEKNTNFRFDSFDFSVLLQIFFHKHVKKKLLKMILKPKI